MIKTWSIFNENNDNIKDVLLKKLSEVREFFYQFEDLDLINYSIVVSGNERSGLIYFNPKNNLNNFIDYITPSIKFGRDINYLGTKPPKRPSFSDGKDFCIVCVIKLPGEPSEFGSTVIGTDGIELFDDIISGISRLKDLGYSVKLDFNASHGEYKPLKILAYFNI